MRYLLLIVMFGLSASCGSGDGGKAGKGETEAVPSPVSGTRGVWLQDVIDAYYGVKLALVEADSAKADSLAQRMKTACDSAKLPATVFDSAAWKVSKDLLGDLSSECWGFMGEATLEAKRRSFNMMGEHLYPLLQAAGYDRGQVYRQACPMAFNDSEMAGWLSDSREIVNPYLGRKHPKYGAGMLHCGELVDSLTKAR